MKEHFLDRIYGEYQAYKASILGCTNAEIFGKSYEIDCIVNIYEILAEKAERLSEDVIAALMKQKNILRSLYELWLQKEDSSYQELEGHVADEIENMAAFELSEGGKGDGAEKHPSASGRRD